MGGSELGKDIPSHCMTMIALFDAFWAYQWLEHIHLNKNDLLNKALIYRFSLG